MKKASVGAVFVACSLIAAGIEPPPHPAPLPNFDRREEQRPALAIRGRAEAALRAQMNDVRIDRDPVTQSPSWILSTTRFLTGPNGEGGAVQARTLAEFAKRDPHRAVKAFLNEYRGIFGHDATALDAAKVAREDVSPTGLRTIVWQQYLDEIPVFDGVLKVELAPRGELVNIGSQFVPAAAKAGAPKRARRITAQQAIALAAQQTGAQVREDAVTARGRSVGATQRQAFTAPGLNEANAQLTWLPMNANTLRLCWNVIITNRARGEMFLVLIDTQTGAAHVRRGLTEYISDASYRVYTSDSPSPMSPGLAVPGSTQPALTARTLVTTPALNTTASPNGWIDDGVNETRGNNVDAHTDTNADNVADLPRPQGSPNRVFDFALDLTTQAPTAYRDAAVTNLFYWCNRVHDRYYELGFTEAAGNFQNNNFGKGGVGNDAVQADAQDGSGTNNANFSTPPDGTPGRMQMYVFTGPTPDRDGDFDAEVMVHEYTHGLSNRLVGGGVGISAVQTRGMGEGWSDFYALCLLSEAGDNVDGNYASGAYASFQIATGFDQNYYFGIRRYPYSTDLTKNPLTFKDIDPAQISAHTGVPKSTAVGGGGADEVHNQGEVWCNTLWEARAGLVKKLGFAAGNNLALQLVTDGMKLAPANPNFLQARDAIIQADLVANAGANRLDLWTAFAKRGMGASATSPASATTTGVVESYDLPDDLGVSPNTVFAATGTIGGLLTPSSQTYTLRNNGAAAVTWSAAKTQPWLTLSATSGTLAPGATVGVTATLNAGAGQLAVGNYPDTITFHNAASGANLARSVMLSIIPPAAYTFTLDTNPGWTVTGQWAFGHPTGGGGASYGFHDPTNGATGANVLGVNLAGDYSTAVGGPYYVTTSALNLTGLGNTRLQFQRWLNTDYQNWAYATIEVSTNGTTWTQVWSNGTVPIADSAWTKVQYDISALADNKATVFIRWGYQIGLADVFPYAGWNIDDIEILAATPNSLAITLPATVTEGDAPVTGTVTAIPAPANDLVVTLTASDPARLGVPATVTIAAGTTTATFAISTIDDALLNGSESVSVTPGAPLWGGHPATLVVQDNETATLSVSLPATATEGDGSVAGTISVSAPPATDVTVQLASSAPGDAAPPATVTIPAGQTSTPFSLAIIDDTRIDGTRLTTVTASVANWTSGSATIAIADNETTNLALTLPVNVREGDTGKTGTVRISGSFPTDLVVALSSDDTTEITVPPSVIIAAGQTSATFAITVVDDPEVDGAQTANVSASANGFTTASAAIVVADNDAHHFTVTTAAGPHLRNAPIAATITARDVNNVTITNYNSAVVLSGMGDGGPVPFSPASVSSFVNGVWSGNVTAGAFGTNVVLIASDAGGHTGQSAPFDVIAGPLHHFAWSTVASPQTVDTPFPVTITAADVVGNTVSGFNGSANLGAKLPGTVQILSWVGYADQTVSPPGEYLQTKTAISTFFTNYAETNTSVTDPTALAAALAGKHVFLVPEQESTPGGMMGTLGTAWASVLTSFVNNGGTIIVCSDLNDEHLLLVNSGLLTATKGLASTSVSVTKPGDTPLNAGVATPFTGSYISTYTGINGTVSLQSAVDGNPVVFSRNIGFGRVVMIGTDFYTLGTGMDRIVANAVSTTLAVGGPPVPLRPATATFAGGLWSGSVSVPFTGIGLALTADDHAGHTGDSNAIAVQSFTPPAGSGLIVTMPASATEGAGNLTGTVAVTSALASDLTINLTSGAPAKVTVPPTAIIPAGQLSANFTFQVLDDTLIEGPKTVQIAASAAGSLAGTGTIQILDNDVATLTLALPAALTEGGPAGVGTVSLIGSIASPVTVALNSSDPTTTVPASVTIPLGSGSAQFAVTAVNDNKIEGPQIVTVTATVAGWTPASGTVLVQDDENFNLAVTIPASLREGDAPKTGTVSLSGVLPGDLVVMLNSSDTSQATVPASVTIPAGQSSATFALSIVDDSVADGPQPITITASAAGFVSGTANGTVRDNDADHFTFAPIGTPEVKNGPVPAIVTARDASNAPILDYNSTITLTATGSGGPLVVTPSTANAFVNGVWNGTVQINALATNVILTASDGFGHTGTSNAFDLVAGNLDHFVWDAIGSPQTLDTPFTVTVRAADIGGSPVPGYNGLASLTLLYGTPNLPIGTGNTSVLAPIYTPSQDSRSETLFTAAELGGAARLTALAMTVVSVNNETLTNWTIRLKHTPLPNLNTLTNWDNTGWTQVYRASPTISTTGLVTFTFSTPFDYDGTSNLLVDFSMDRTTTNSSYTYVAGTNTSQASLIFGFSNSTNGDPLTWSGSTPSINVYSQRPNVQFSSIKELPLRPTQSGAFVNGVWTGQVSAPLAGTGLALRARAGGISGTSNAFDVVAPPPPTDGGATVFAEDFESGTFSSAWTLTGTGNFRIQNTTANGPHGGTHHMTMDEALDSGNYERSEATVTLNLAGRTSVVLKFWANGYSEDPDGPPASPFPSTGANFDGVAISADGGVNWYEVQGLRSLTGIYTQYTVDLDAAMAAHGLAYSSNFKIRFNQYDNYAIPTDGIGIDDILVTANAVSGFSVAVPTQAAENAGTLSGTVTLDAVRATDSVFTLASSALAKVTVPASVTIPAGQLSAPFALNVIDDTIVDGNRLVVITATLTGTLPRSASILILDNDTTTLAIAAPASATEGATGVTGTVTLGTPPSGNVVVNLSSSDTTAAQVPATVNFAPGQQTASFPITIVDDTKIDGTQTAVLTASVPGWTAASTTIQILDNETRNLSLSGPFSVYEGATATGTVSISGTLPAPLVVTLTSANPAQLTVPATVTIPTGSTSASFTATGVDDTLTDGTQTVVITASAATFNNATVSTSVYDNDIHHFAFGTIATSQVRGQPFSITVSARDINNVTITPFTGAVNLSASAGGAPVPITPATTGNFSSGSWTGNVTISNLASNVIITAQDAAGHTGTSNSFNVGTGTLNKLVWSAIPSPVTPNIGFAASVSAQDAFGNTMTGFNGPVALSAGPAQRAIGVGTNTSTTPLYATYPVARSQIIYLASEIAGAGKLTGLALDVTAVPTAMTRFTIRLRHTTLASYASSTNWETTGWTTVFQSDLAVANTGWLFFNFTAPFQYDGTSNLMVDFSFDVPAGTFGTSGSVHSAFASTTRQIYNYSSSPSSDPLTWTGTTPSAFTTSALPNLQLRVERPVPVNPASVTLAGGVWTGSLSVGATGTGLTLTADSAAGLTGESNAFNSAAVAALGVSPAGPLTTSGFRGGPFTPGSHTFTVSNGGTGSMTWTAATTAPWLSLSSSGGTLGPSASTTVVATVDTALAATYASGSFAASVAFANTTNGIGDTPRTINLVVSPFGQLTVTPGPNGTYALGNAGDATLNWTVSNAAPWLNVTPVAGTLAPGANATVTGTPNALAAVLPPGHYTAPLIFTNSSTGQGTVTMTSIFDVLPPAPMLQAEPPFSGGAANTIAWFPASGATSYEAQAAVTGDFSGAQSSGWIPGPTQTFSPLLDGQLYRYRVRSGTLLQTFNAWSQSTPADLASGTGTNVISDGTGITLVNSPGGPIAGRVLNAGFESGVTGTGGNATSWTASGTTQMGANPYSSVSYPYPPMPTAGANFELLFTYYQTAHVPGDFTAVSQVVDLTGVTALTFDAKLVSSGVWAGTVRADIRIDGVSVWNATTLGNYLNQSISTTGYSGLHTLELRETVIVGGTFDSQWVCWDNIQALGVGGYVSTGSLVSPVIAATPLHWGQLFFSADTPAATTLTVDVLDAAGAVLAAGIPNGADLGALPVLTGRTALRLRANLATANPSAAPRLRAWTATWAVGNDATTSAGAWSNVVTSTQDASGPQIVVTSSATRSLTEHEITGTAVDLAGIANLTVNGIPALTGDNFQHWTTPPFTLSPGANVFTIVAHDGAVPPNTSNTTWNVTFSPATDDADGDGLPDAWEVTHGLNPASTVGDNGAHGDPDHDGLCNLIEWAFNLDPTSPDTLPPAQLVTDPNDGLPYLTWQYRRRLDPGTLIYIIEASGDLVTWHADAAWVQQIGAPVPNADGLTETVTVRARPSVSATSKRYLHLRVTTP